MGKHHTSHIPTPGLIVQDTNLPHDAFPMMGIGAEDIQQGSCTLPTEADERFAAGAQISDFDALELEQADIESKREEAAYRARALLAQKRKDENPWQMVRLS